MACAACRHQRKKCKPQCPLAPFFPADEPEIFERVLKVFGVDKGKKLLSEVEPGQEAVAVHSIKYHAVMRNIDPVHGCFGEIRQLQDQIKRGKEERDAVRELLKSYRQQQMPPTDDHLPQLQLGVPPVHQQNNNNDDDDDVTATAQDDDASDGNGNSSPQDTNQDSNETQNNIDDTQ